MRSDEWKVANQSNDARPDGPADVTDAPPADRLPTLRARRIRRQVATFLALIALVLLGMHQAVQYTITVGYIVGLILMPLWVPAVRRYTGAVALITIAIVALLSGIWLAGMTASTHVVTEKYVTSNVALLLGLVITVGVVVWARELVPDWAVGAAFGLGMVAAVMTSPIGGATNEWKQEYALPVVVLVLALSAGVKGRLAGLVGLFALAAISALNDSRSTFGELITAALLVLWQMVPRGKARRHPAVRTLLMLGVVALLVYNIGTALLVNGALGVTAQQRTLAQIDESGSVLLGGRPEAAASFALFQSTPWGYGLGVQPTLGDVQIAKAGMASINYRPNNGYVENYMLGSTFELHSVLADMWALLGIAGILLVATIAALVLRWAAVGVAARSAAALPLFLAILTMWNLLFSPFYTSSIVMGLTLGLMLLPKGKGCSKGIPSCVPPARDNFQRH